MSAADEDDYQDNRVYGSSFYPFDPLFSLFLFVFLLFFWRGLISIDLTFIGLGFSQEGQDRAARHS